MIRTYNPDDFEKITRLWFDAQVSAMPGLMLRMGYEFEGAQNFFKNVVLLENQIWVYEKGGIPQGFIALQGELIDRLYVAPSAHRCGIGSALLAHARQLQPRHLWLFTHMGNSMARSFYEKNHFVAERFGLSPAPEWEPDVEYHWRQNGIHHHATNLS